MSLSASSFGSIPRFSRRERIRLYAAVADSFITSPICPVSVMTPLARHARGFDEQESRRPPACTPSPSPRPERWSGSPIPDRTFADPAPALTSLARDGDLVGFALDDFRRDRPGDRADLPLQISHPRLARVALDDPAQRLRPGISPASAARRWLPVAAAPGYRRAMSSLSLLVYPGISITSMRSRSGPGTGVHRVGRGDEQHPRQIERHVQIMVR